MYVAFVSSCVDQITIMWRYTSGNHPTDGLTDGRASDDVKHLIRVLFVPLVRAD